MRALSQRHFTRSRAVQTQLLPAVVTLFADHFVDGDKAAARSVMLQRMTDDAAADWLLGLKGGICLTLLAVVIFALIQVNVRPRAMRHAHYRTEHPDDGAGGASGYSMVSYLATWVGWQFAPGFVPLFRACAWFVAAVWVWGICVYVWTRSRVSFVFLLELHPRTRLSYAQIFSEAVSLSLLYLVMLTLFLTPRYFFSENHLGIHRIVVPATLVTWLLLKVVMPTAPFSYWKTRRFLLKTATATIAVPWTRARFLHVYAAEALCLAVRPAIDLAYGYCIYAKGVVPSVGSATIRVTFICVLLHSAHANLTLDQYATSHTTVAASRPLFVRRASAAHQCGGRKRVRGPSSLARAADCVSAACGAPVAVAAAAAAARGGDAAETTIATRRHRRRWRRQRRNFCR
jgi:hypothetical protein